MKRQPIQKKGDTVISMERRAYDPAIDKKPFSKYPTITDEWRNYEQFLKDEKQKKEAAAAEAKFNRDNSVLSEELPTETTAPASALVGLSSGGIDAAPATIQKRYISTKFGETTGYHVTGDVARWLSKQSGGKDAMLLGHDDQGKLVYWTTIPPGKIGGMEYKKANVIDRDDGIFFSGATIDGMDVNEYARSIASGNVIYPSQKALDAEDELFRKDDMFAQRNPNMAWTKILETKMGNK